MKTYIKIGTKVNGEEIAYARQNMLKGAHLETGCYLVEGLDRDVALSYEFIGQEFGQDAPEAVRRFVDLERRKHRFSTVTLARTKYPGIEKILELEGFMKLTVEETREVFI